MLPPSSALMTTLRGRYVAVHTDAAMTGHVMKVLKMHLQRHSHQNFADLLPSACVHAALL